MAQKTKGKIAAAFLNAGFTRNEPLSYDAYSEIFASLGMTRKQLDKLFAILDANSSGRINWSEFLDWVIPFSEAGGVGASEPVGSVEDLLNAIAWGNCTEAKRLIESGYSVNADMMGVTPLLWALGVCETERGWVRRTNGFEENEAFATWLVERGADVNAKCSDLVKCDLDPLHYAIVQNQANCQGGEFLGLASLLIAKGADVNSSCGCDADTPLTRASLLAIGENEFKRARGFALIKQLWDAKAEVDKRSEHGGGRNGAGTGFTALHMACFIGGSSPALHPPEHCLDVAKLLVDHGADPEITAVVFDTDLMKRECKNIWASGLQEAQLSELREYVVSSFPHVAISLAWSCPDDASMLLSCMALAGTEIASFVMDPEKDTIGKLRDNVATKLEVHHWQVQFCLPCGKVLTRIDDEHAVGQISKDA